jgi:hypothetical protein
MSKQSVIVFQYTENKQCQIHLDLKQKQTEKTATSAKMKQISLNLRGV